MHTKRCEKTSPFCIVMYCNAEQYFSLKCCRRPARRPELVHPPSLTDCRRRPLPRCSTRTPLLGRDSAAGGLRGMTSAPGLRQDWVPSGFSRGRERHELQLGNGASRLLGCVSIAGAHMFAAQDIEAGGRTEERPLVSTCSGCLPDATHFVYGTIHDLEHLCSMSSSNLTITPSRY